jgi:hypothetical protein
MIYITIIILIFDNKNILKQTHKTNETYELIKPIKKKQKKSKDIKNKKIILQLFIEKWYFGWISDNI